MISELNISDTVEICITDKNEEKHYYRTKIEDIDLDNIFYTMVPTSEEGRPVAFFKGKEYDLCLKKEEGIWIWKVMYLGYDKQENHLSCKFKAVSLPRTTQRRDFYRLNITMPILVKKIGDEGEPSDEECIGLFLDISGGGCAFISNNVLKLKEKILCNFEFRKNRFSFNGTILDKMNIKCINKNYDYKYRVKWENVNPKEEELLAKLVFIHQRELLTKNTDK